MNEAKEKAERAAKRINVLRGEKIHLAEGHFTERIAATLNRFIQDLGAEPTPERLEANIVLQNPASEASRAEKQKVAALLRANPGLSQIHVPYVWLSLCHNGLARAEISNPLVRSPFFVKDSQPLRVWVSLNVHKDLPGETPYQARQTLWDALVAGGALIVEKRAQADILVVDYGAKFWVTIKEEMDTHNREQEQKAVERDWVNDCVAQRRVNWMSGKGAEKAKKDEEEDSEEESFGEEDMPAKKGPGRPTGGRRDYTPQDDDFLVRWLAAHSSHGSYSSRKTYETMVGQSERYPIAAGHSFQSWHERFRKQQNSLKGRIAQLMNAGIDDSLKTKEEREKEAAKAATASAREVQAAPAPGPSTSTSASAGPEPKLQAKSKSNGKRALVSPDPDSDPEDAAAAAPALVKMKRTAEALATEKMPESNAMDIDPPAPSQPQVAAPFPPALPQADAIPPAASQAAPKPPTPSQPLAPAPSQSAAPAPPAPSQSQPAAPAAGPSRSQPLQGDSITVDQSLDPEPEPEPEVADEAGASQPAGQQPAESQQSNTSDGPEDLLAGMETQAIMSDFARLQAVALASRQAVQPPITTQAVVEMFHQEVIIPSTNAIRAESSTQARAPSLPRSPQPAADHAPPPAKRPRHTEPVHQRARSPRSEMPAPRSAARAPRISQATDGSGKQRINLPVQVNFRVVGVTQDGSTEEEGEAEYRPKRTPRASLKRDGGTPSLHRDLLQNHIAPSTSGSARRQPRHSHGSSRRHHSPDTVYASPAVPPAAPRTPSVASPSVSIPHNSNNHRRRSSPSPREVQAAILDGQEVARRHAEEYKERIRNLTKRYNAPAMEVYKALDSTKAPGEVKLPWDEIERRLDVYYQYAG